MQVLSELKADDLPYVLFNDELDAPPTSTELPSGMNKMYIYSITKVTFMCIPYDSMCFIFKVLCAQHVTCVSVNCCLIKLHCMHGPQKLGNK